MPCDCDKKEQILFYNTNTQAYYAQAKVFFPPMCNGFVVKNAGNQLLIFDDETLQPGESKAVGGNKGEIFIGRKDLNFQVPAGFVGTPNNVAYVTFKYYVPVDPISAQFSHDL